SELEVRAARGRLLLDRLSFAIEPGQLVAVLGSSGAGKSTLLRALNGSQGLSWGELRFDGLAPGCLPAPGTIGYVPQDDIIHPGLTVWRALLYAAALRLPAGTPLRERRARVRATLVDVGLEEQAGSPIGRLSVGQRKRVCIAVEVLTR